MSESAREWAIPKGFRATGIKAGIKPSGIPDLAVVVADGPCAAAGTFTTNRVCAAPVQWSRSVLPSDSIRAIVINAGNANAATGAGGLADARATAEAAARRLGCRTEDVLVASTGIIGRRLPMDRLLGGLDQALERVEIGAEGFRAASEAILTTDTRPKVVSHSAVIGGREVSVFGFAKGAAMIGPNMATMLGFLMTDAPVRPNDLLTVLRPAVEESFNCISVEGHMSTNDSVFLLAQAPEGATPLADDDLDRFATLVKDACIALARMIPADGEGATHFVTIEVQGCSDRAEARAIAQAVADSPLVKTAIHGADPNWGRIVSAAGYAGVPFDESELSLELNGVPLYRDGTPLDFPADEVSRGMRENRDVEVRLTLKRGTASIRVWTCDLTSDYVRLNADYTT